MRPAVRLPVVSQPSRSNKALRKRAIANEMITATAPVRKSSGMHRRRTCDHNSGNVLIERRVLRRSGVGNKEPSAENSQNTRTVQVPVTSVRKVHQMEF